MAIGIAVAIPHADINVLLSALRYRSTALLVITFTDDTPRQAKGAVGQLRAEPLGKAASGRSPSSSRCSWRPVPTRSRSSWTSPACATSTSRSSGLASWTLNLGFTLVFMSVLFLSEELGWRAYMLPRVQQLTSRRRAAVLTGFVHGCFHLPLALIATTYDQHGSRWLIAPMMVAVITAGGVFYAYLWDRSHSVWPAAIAHGTVNTAFQPWCRSRGGFVAGRPGLRRR